MESFNSGPYQLPLSDRFTEDYQESLLTRYTLALKSHYRVPVRCSTHPLPGVSEGTELKPQDKFQVYYPTEEKLFLQEGKRAHRKKGEKIPFESLKEAVL